MQASKIKVKSVYAIRRGEKLLRFRVSKVVTERRDNTGSPHDYRSSVVGNSINPDGVDSDLLTLQPDEVLGEFTEYQELVQQKEAEEAERKRKLNEEEKQVTDFLHLLCRKAGLPRPVDRRDYKAPIRIEYSGVIISREAIPAVTKMLKEVVDKF